MIRKIIDFFAEKFTQDETAEESKKKWNRLAVENAKYFIYSDKTKQEDENFRLSGENDFNTLIESDEIVKKSIPDFRKATVLEIGCGIGRVTEFLAKNFEKVYAVDISGEMIQKLKDRLKEYNNIIAIENDGMHLPLPEKSVDFVFSYIVFQHMPQKNIIEKNFQEIGRVLKKGGIFKVQLRGVRASKKEWYYGAEYNYDDAVLLAEKNNFQALNYSGVGEKYFWLTLEKR